MSAQVERAELTIRDLLEAGVHFGHQTRRWNPRMKRFLFGERNGVHIVDLDQTLPRLQKSLDFLRDTVAAGGKVLFVSTKRQAQAFVEAEAQRCEQYYVSRRWLGGMLTNFKTVRKSIEHFKELLELVGDAEKVAEISKKELSGINRSIEKYKKSLDGIKEMTRLPDALFIIDVGRELIAVKEANRLGIPIVAIVDSNCDPESIDFVVPGNDDSTRAIQLYCQRVADACAEGARISNERIQSQVSEQERARGTGEISEKVGTGRVVVEIKQQPRRGRGTHSATPREREQRSEPAKTEEAEAPTTGVPASE
jgi:ribosomal protein S2, bacterial type